MALTTLAFSFKQKFSVPAQALYAWATAYDAKDIERLGKQGHRKIERLNADTVMLHDTVLDAKGNGVTKPKLVRLYPERFTWVNTHVGGPNQHSQFLYEITPTGRNTCLFTFTARQVIHGSTATPAAVKRQTAAVKKEDVLMWKHLARVMAQELQPARPRR
jgi:hypothetical protein